MAIFALLFLESTNSQQTALGAVVWRSTSCLPAGDHLALIMKSPAPNYAQTQHVVIVGWWADLVSWSCVMPRSPSIVPDDTNRDVYLVLDDFGRLGRAWRETDEAGADRATLVRNLLDGQYEHPVRIVAFNTAEGWSRDVTAEIADELRRRYVEYHEVPESVLTFLEVANRR